jgi:probable DNA metabolism protein
MITYVYDGTFEGLLTSIHEVYYRREKPDRIVRTGNRQQNFLEVTKIINTDITSYLKVYNSIKDKISDNALQNVYYAYLSEIENNEICILNYLRLGWRVGKNVDNYIFDEMVNKVIDSSRKVTGECHRMLGLLRFRKFKEDFYYSAIEPQYNILELIAPHFSERFADQCFIIQDLKRSKAVVYDMNNWYITSTIKNYNLNQGENEEEYERLWKQYFKNIAIHEKTNYKLQRGHMPKYYWKHLIEKPQ